MPATWSSGGNLITARKELAGCGTQLAGLSFGGNDGSVCNETEEYNGTAWSSGGNLATSRRALGGCGVQSAGLSFGGSLTQAVTEEYNGAAWSSGGALATGRRGMGGAGTQSAGLCIGGYSSTREDSTEEYNGTAWSAGGDLVAPRSGLAGAGTESAGLSFGGWDTALSVKTEEYNGTAWSSGGDLATARSTLAGCGTQSAGLAFGGSGPSAITEEYNGTAWSSADDLTTARSELAGCGTQVAGLSFGGYSASYSPVTEEYGLAMSTDSFSGKIRIGSKTTNLFDGKIQVEQISIDPFDGKLRIKDEITKSFDGKLYVHILPGAWSSGGSLLTGRHSLGGCGTQSAGLNFGGEDSGDTTSSVCEEYSGTAWSSGGALIAGRRNIAGCGSQAAGLNFGGTEAAGSKDSDHTEEYNGTAWSVGGYMSLARTALAGCGTQSAALCFGGNDGGVLETETEEYNGTAWSAGGDLATAREWLAGAGTQSAGLSFGGYTTSQSVKTEEYNGTAWSSGGDLGTARSALGGCGIQSAGLSFGGTTGANSAITEEYNDVTWWTSGNLTTARYGLGGCGSNTAGLGFGGYQYLTSTEEYDPGPPANFTHLFDSKLNIFMCTTDLFDGKLEVKFFPTNFFDGKLIVKDAAINVYDGKVRISDEVINLFDGWIYLLRSTSNLFDGRVKAQFAPTELFDGIIKIKDSHTYIFDGKTRLWDETINPFDGRIHLFKTSSNLFDGKATVNSPGKEQGFFDGKVQIGNINSNLFDGKAHIHIGLPYIWSYGGDLLTSKDYMGGAGTQSAGLCIGGNPVQKTTEEYNGILWSIGGDLAEAKYQSGACGVQTAALNFAGYQSGIGDTKNTEHYNGTVWSSDGDLPTTRRMVAGAGTETAALCIGGSIGGTRGVDTDEYNGTAWSSGGDLTFGRDFLAGAGTQTAGLSICGRNSSFQPIVNTDEYNGTAWSSGGDSGVARYQLCGCGIETAALNFAGHSPNLTTEEYDGSSWTTASNLNSARARPGGCGALSAGLCFGGCCTYKTSEEYGTQGSQDAFDGKLYLFELDTPLFDGRVVICPPGYVEFDGRVHLFKYESNLFDGKVDIALQNVWQSAAEYPNARSGLGGCGSQTTTMAFFGEFDGLVWSQSYWYNGTAWTFKIGEVYITRFANFGSVSAAVAAGGYADYRRIESYDFNGSTWSQSSDLSVAVERLPGAGSPSAGLIFGGYGAAPKTKLTEEYNGTNWSSGGDLIVAECDHAGCGSQTAALSFGYWNTEEYNGTAWSAGGVLNSPRNQLAGCGTQTAALSFGGSAVTEEYDGTSWAIRRSMLTGRGKLAGSGSVDAALSIAGNETRYVEEYGLIGYNVFDGKIQLKDETINLFDGKAYISNFDTGLFDGKATIGNFGSDLFDGKLRLGLTWRESLLGGFGEPYKLDIDPPLGSSSICSVRFSLVVTETRTILSALGETVEYLLHIPMAEVNQQAVVNCLSNYISAIQRSLNRLSVGNPSSGKQSVFTSLQSDAGAMVLRNELSGIVAGIQSLITALTDGVSSHVSLINELALKDDIHSLLVLLGSMPDPAVLYPDCTLNVYLDGVPIKPKQITSLSFTMDRGVTFDVLSINSTDMRLYASLQMIVGNEDSVIEVQYQGTSWMFLIEEVSGFELSFSVWGRSIAAAKSDAPFKDSANFVLEEDTVASIVAEDLVPELSVTWNAVDWTILADWSVDGTPVQMLKTLADSIGAVVRSYPDGTGFYVDEKYTTRPVNLPYAASEADFDRDVNLISLDASRDLGTGANAVTVHGYSPLSKYSVRLEAESCVEVGSPAVIKVYPALNGSGYSLIASDGAPTYQHSLAEEHTEVVNFVGGKGSVSYPITALTSITWDGAAPAGFEYTAGQDEIVLTDDTPAAVGEVVYSTRYDVWHGVHSGEGQLLVVCYLDESGGIVARVYFDEGDREADDIDKPILTSIEAAVAAGQAFLDDTSYNRLLRSITAPCSDVSDGDVVCVSSDLSGVTGNTIVLRHEVSAQVDGEALKISSNLEVVQFEV